MALCVGATYWPASSVDCAIEKVRTNRKMRPTLSASGISPRMALSSSEIRTTTASSSRCFVSKISSTKIASSAIGACRRAQSVGLHVTSFPWRDRIDCQREERRKCWMRAASEEEVYLPDLQVPRAWVAPDIAAQEADWLRRSLHQWLDDEFCPERTNEEISARCAKVYYYCLLEEQLDVGDILMQMVRDLETLSFKESFHGPFSSANAAIDLITKRMRDKAASSN